MLTQSDSKMGTDFNKLSALLRKNVEQTFENKESAIALLFGGQGFPYNNMLQVLVTTGSKQVTSFVGSFTTFLGW